MPKQTVKYQKANTVAEASTAVDELYLQLHDVLHGYLEKLDPEDRFLIGGRALNSIYEDYYMFVIGYGKRQLDL